MKFVDLQKSVLIMILVSLLCMKVLAHKEQWSWRHSPIEQRETFILLGLKGQNRLVEAQDHVISKTCTATFSTSDSKPQGHNSNSEAKISASRALSC